MSAEPQLQLRTLTEEDAEDFRKVRLRALSDVPMAYASSYEEWVTRPIESIKQRLRNEGESSDNFVMAAFRDEMVGMVGLLRHLEIKLRHKALIWGVYVAPEERGRGTGRALMEETIQRASAIAGVEHLYLSVATVNEPARKLYLSLGFKPYGIEPRAHKIGDRYYDEEIMVLWLS